MCLYSVKADGKQMESTADGALDPWSCFIIVTKYAIATISGPLCMFMALYLNYLLIMCNYSKYAYIVFIEIPLHTFVHPFTDYVMAS